MKISNIEHIKELEKINHLKDKFVIMNSSIMALLGIRKNRDLDLLVTKDFPKNINLNSVSINRWDRWKHRIDKFAIDSKDFINKNSFELSGYNFCKLNVHRRILEIRISQNSGGEKVKKDLLLLDEFLDNQFNFLCKDKKIFILNLFSPIKNYWKEEVALLKERFNVIEYFIANYNKNDWKNYFIDFYAQCSDPPGLIESVNVAMMKKKAHDIEKSGKEMCVIILNLEEPNYKEFTPIKNPSSPMTLVDIKNSIRKKYMNKGYEKWKIAHTFDTHVNTYDIVKFIKNRCDITCITEEEK